MQLNRFRINPHDFDERVDRLVWLLVEQKIQPFEIRAWQGA